MGYICIVYTTYFFLLNTYIYYHTVQHLYKNALPATGNTRVYDLLINPNKEIFVFGSVT